MKSRTRRNYSGTVNPAKKISELLPEIALQIAKKREDPRDEIFRVWFTLIQEKWGPFTEPISFQNGVLTVKVKSSTLYSLLAAHEKGRLLKELQGKFSIRNLVFRVG